MMNVLLITGWGVGTAPLKPLQHTLEQYFTVELVEPYDDLTHQAQTADLLIGWSLGGQIAIDLGIKLHKKVITLASNPCFVQNTNWQTAMPQTQFEAFKKGYLTHPKKTLKQFYLNVCKGQANPKACWQHLLEIANPPSDEKLKKGLQQLEQLNLVEQAKQLDALHIHAEHDTLVPRSIHQQQFKNVGHAFCVFDVEKTVRAILMYLAMAS